MRQKMRKKSGTRRKAIILPCILFFIMCLVLLQYPGNAYAGAISVYGKVIDGATGQGIANARLYVFDVENNYVTLGVSDQYGNYAISDLPSGDYKLLIPACEPSYGKSYASEWYNGKFSKEEADPIITSSGIGTKADVVLNSYGSMSGHVASSLEPEGIKDVYVYAYDLNYRLRGRGITDSQGQYRIPGLYAGQYRIRFDTQRADRPYCDGWYSNSDSFETSAVVTVAWNAETASIDASIAQAAAKDNRMKAVVIYGSAIGNVGEYGDLWAAQYLEARNFRVERLYSEADPNFDLNPSWDVLGDIFEGAKIIVYYGHGIYYGNVPECRVGGFYAMGLFFGYPQLSTVNFAKNPVVVFSGACFTAGDYSLPVSSTDEQKEGFIAMYSNDFMGWERGDYYNENSWRINYQSRNLGFALYYANNGGLSDFFDKLFSNKTMRLNELINADYVEDPYRFNDDRNPANPMKEDYEMLLPKYIGNEALVGNMNLTTKDIIPPIPAPDPPPGYNHLSYFAEGCTRSGFQEYLTLCNPMDSEALAQVVYLFPDGNWHEQKVTIPASSRATIGVNAIVGSDKDVSVRIASDMPIAAERPMYFNYQGKWSGGSDVIGATTPANSWYFAEGYTGAGFDQWICVLNPGEVPAELTFRFQTQEAGEIVKQGGYIVPANSRATFKANDLLGGSFQNSLEIVASQPVVAERSMYFSYGGQGGWGWTGGHCVMGVTSLGQEYLFAEGTTRGGFEEWLTLQNPGDVPIIVEATYQLGVGQGDNIKRSYSVNPGRRFTVFVPDEVGAGKDVSVKLSSTSQFLAERPMYFLYTGYGANYTGGHCVIGASAPASDWFLAEGYTGQGFQEWLCIQNPGLEEAIVDVSYLTQETGVLPAKEWRIPPKSRVTVRVNDDAGQGYQLSCRLKVISGPAVVVERPMYFVYGGWDGGHDVVGLRN